MEEPMGLGNVADSGDSTKQSDRADVVAGGRVDVMPNLKGCAGTSW